MVQATRYYFGFGLSYASFEYIGMDVQIDKDMLYLKLKVKNTETLDGEEAVQIYVRDCQASKVRPVMELAGFKRVFIKAGETKRLNFSVKISQFAFLDHQMRWKVEVGEMEVMAGASADRIYLRDKFYIQNDLWIEGKNRGFYAEVTETDE